MTAIDEFKESMQLVSLYIGRTSWAQAQRWLDHGSRFAKTTDEERELKEMAQALEQAKAVQQRRQATA